MRSTNSQTQFVIRASVAAKPGLYRLAGVETRRQPNEKGLGGRIALDAPDSP